MDTARVVTKRDLKANRTTLACLKRLSSSAYDGTHTGGSGSDVAWPCEAKLCLPPSTSSDRGHKTTPLERKQEGNFTILEGTDRRVAARLLPAGRGERGRRRGGATMRRMGGLHLEVDGNISRRWQNPYNFFSS